MSHNEIYRIIDANVNRASEALRVLEDWARFSKNNALISEKLKNIRHLVNSKFKEFSNLVLSRESLHDVGRELENKTNRKSVRDLITANCKRAEEALRVLSEYGQVLQLDIKDLENIRYEIYTIEKELIKNEKLIRLNSACLYLVACRDNITSGDKFLSIIEKSIEGGVDIIQLREKNECESKILELAKEIKRIINNTEVLFIINDRVDLALGADSDGVHLGQNDLPVNEAKKITPDGFIIGLSTHSIEQGQKALLTGADYLGVGPVFPTPTKPDYKVAGLEYVRWANENITLPYFAIGGIDETNIDKVISAGARKIAVVRAIINAQDPLNVTKKLKKSLLENNKAYAEIR